MKLKKVLAFGLAAAMAASMAVGVSATATTADGDTVIRTATAGENTPAQGNADIAVEGIIEPTVNTSTDEDLRPTDPTGDSAVSSGWVDPVVDDTSQLLITAPAKMKFVVSGKGTAAELTAETVSGTIKNASAYIPAEDGTVRPKEVGVTVKTITETSAQQASNEFKLYAATVDLANEDISPYKGAVKGIDLSLTRENETTASTIDFGAALSADQPLGTLKKGSLTTDNGVYPSRNAIAFEGNSEIFTKFDSEQKGRLVNNYTMGLTFTYIQ